MSTTFERTSSELTTRNPEASASQLGSTMIEGLVAEQQAQEITQPEVPETGLRQWPENLYARELMRNPISNLREVGGSEGIFNVTVLSDIEDGQEVDYLFGREVLEAAPWGQPDAGSLVLARLDSERNIVAKTEVWNPAGKEFGIEDPRARPTAFGIDTGVTVVKTEGDKIKTYPGVIKLGSPTELLTGPFPEVRIIDKFGGGDQSTPMDGESEGKNSTAIDETELMYRPEGLNLTLHVLDVTEDDVTHVGFIDFPPDIPYASYKIGTTTTPELLNDQAGRAANVREYVFKFHGINKTRNGETIAPDDEGDDIVFEYSIGVARLLRSVNQQGRALFSIDNISRRAILTPDSFPPLGDDRQVELHPDKRRAEYLCGSKPTRNADGDLTSEVLFPNQGDKRTWDALLETQAVVETWDRTIPPIHQHALAA